MSALLQPFTIHHSLFTIHQTTPLPYNGVHLIGNVSVRRQAPYPTEGLICSAEIDIYKMVRDVEGAVPYIG